MRGGSVAKRYATALIRVAQDTNNLDGIQRDLDRLAMVVSQNKDLKEVMESPVLAPIQKKAIFKSLQEKLNLGESVRNLSLILIDQDRMDVLPLLGRLFQDMADEALGQVRVTAKVASELGSQEATLKATLEKALGLRVILEVSVNPKLLGGMAIQVGDKVFDGSLKRELEEIKESIVKKAVA